MKKIKVGLFIDDYYPSLNGVVLVVDNYAKRLSKYCDVVVVAPVTQKNYVFNANYKVIRVPSRSLHFIDYHLAKTHNKKLYQQLKDEHFDIVHIHSPFSIGKLGVKIAHEENIPVIGTMHTRFDLDFKRYSHSKTITKMLINNIMKVFNSCDKSYAVNEKIAKVYYDLGAHEMPGVLPNGTELTKSKNYKKSADLVNKTFNISADELVLLFLGRINIQKNILFIADVLNKLKKDGIKFKMLFVGALEDKGALRNKINELHLNNDVIITGKIFDRELIKDIYVRSKLFIFPSLYDASSLVQIEAASQETPTIFIEGSNTSCGITNDVNGFLAPENVDDFALKIENIIKDDMLYQKVSKQAYKDLYHNWDDITANVYKLYLNLIKKK